MSDLKSPTRLRQSILPGQLISTNTWDVRCLEEKTLRNKFGRNNNYCDICVYIYTYVYYKTIENLHPQLLILWKGCAFPFVYVGKHVCISLHACPYRHFPFNILFIGGGGIDPLWREVEVNISFNILFIGGGGFDPLWRLVVFEGPAWGKQVLRKKISTSQPRGQVGTWRPAKWMQPSAWLSCKNSSASRPTWKFPPVRCGFWWWFDQEK